MNYLIKTVEKLTHKVEDLITVEKKLSEENQHLKGQLETVKEELAHIQTILHSKKRKKKKRDNNNKIISSITKHCEKKGLLGAENITCLSPFSENKIVVGGKEGTLCICNLDCIAKKISKLTEQKRAHDQGINFFNIINGGKEMLSCSYDNSIKLWDTSIPSKLQLIRTFNGHTKNVVQAIHIEINKQMVSCSEKEGTVKLWNINQGLPLKTIHEDKKQSPFALLYLKEKNILVVSNADNEGNGYISTYNSKNNYRLIKQNRGVYTNVKYGLLEMGDDCIAVSQSQPFPRICVISISDLSVIDEINDVSIINSGTLLKLGSNSFIYGAAGKICQMMIVDNKLKIEYKNEMIPSDLEGEAGIVGLNDCNYFVTNSNYENNSKFGICIYRIKYLEGS